VILNIDDEITPHAPEFRDASGFTFVVSHDWEFSHKCLIRGFDLEVGQTFNNKNELVNVIKWWHIAYSIEYRAQQLNSIFVQL
jgi:hypothetical protein